MESELRKTGIGVVGDRAWGAHLCLFYDTKEDLLEVVVPYFKAGFESDEYCVWVIPDILTREEAYTALRQILSSLGRDPDGRSFEIHSGHDLYLADGHFDRDRVKATWNEKLAHALAEGYQGMRVVGDAFWLDQSAWRDFYEYEMELTQSLAGRPMSVLCAYPLAVTGATDILDVARAHQCAVAKRNQGWEVVETPVLRNITEAALQQAQADLARAARVTTMGEMAAAIAHETNQPLAAIITEGESCLRWLAQSPPNLDEVREAVNCMVSEANRASDVIRRIRTLLNKGVPTEVPVDIDETIREVLVLMQGLLEIQQVSVRAQLAAGRRPVIGDRVLLQQVMQNLIMNGIEAMIPIIDRPRQLLVRSKLDGSHGVRVEVQDSGVGLDPKDGDRIFEPFVTKKPNGMGMGLSISRSIIEAHGGQIWASPAAPHGAVFQFILPTGIAGTA